MTRDEALKALDAAIADRDTAKQALKAAEKKVHDARMDFIEATKK
jgi:hypothetical protein